MWLTLTTSAITAQRAFEIGLVDEVSANIDDSLRRVMLRLVKLDASTIGNAKRYLDELWIIDDKTRTLAVGTINSLLQSEKVRSNISNFVHKGIFPWNR